MKREFKEYIEMINEIDLELVVLKNKLIPIFLHNVAKEVLDISYSQEERHKTNTLTKSQIQQRNK